MRYLLIGFAILAAFSSGVLLGERAALERVRFLRQPVVVVTDRGVYETEAEARKVYEVLKSLGVKVRWEVRKPSGGKR